MKVALFAFVVLLVDSPVGTNTEANGVQCVVCLPQENNSAADDIYDTFPGLNITECGEGKEQELLRKCPKGSIGCNTQSTDKWQAKSCSFIRANDCQMANGVQYCYCTGNRCNMDINATRYIQLTVQEPAATRSGSTSPALHMELITLLSIHFVLV